MAASLREANLAAPSLAATVAAMRAAFAREPDPPLALRRQRLKILLALIADNEAAIADAISADFGNRSRFETALAEIFVTLADGRHTLRHLRQWMRPQRVSTPWYLLPGSARIVSQPVGVVGILSPWNYPLYLSLTPAIGALAAGNRVILKPSERTPRFSALLQSLVAANFPADLFSVLTGGRELGDALSRLPLDHLFFTGSTAVGREIAQAAAPNLTPVTLELGGKSPAILGARADLPAAARSIAVGKFLNAGQTCIAPDYLFVAAAHKDALIDALRRAASALLAHAQQDYASIIDQRHYDRLALSLDEARAAGAHVIALAAADPATRTLPLTLVIDPPDGSTLMREEIFGPVLPIMTYTHIDEAIAFINRGERPLALYYFGNDAREQRRILRETVSGGVTINDTLWHIAHPGLPFGGAGASGIGSYHGEHSFRRFSHGKGVFTQSRLSAAPLLHPPYGRLAALTLKVLRRFS